MSWRHWPLSEGTFWQEKMRYASRLYSFDNDWQYGCIPTWQSLCLYFYIVILGLTPGFFTIFDHISFLMKCLDRDNLPCWEALIHLTPKYVTCVLRWILGEGTAKPSEHWCFCTFTPWQRCSYLKKAQFILPAL